MSAENDAAEEEEASTTNAVPCVSCEECNRDCTLCPGSDNMWCSRLNKCAMVNILILLVVVVHFTLSAQVNQHALKSEPRQSDDLCKNPACDCIQESQGWSIECSCVHYQPGIPKTFVLPFPVVIPTQTFSLLITKCENAVVAKSGLKMKEVIIPEWFGVHNITGNLIFNPDVVILGRNIVISNVRRIPELPAGILRMASSSNNVNIFQIEHVDLIDVVRSRAIFNAHIKTNFTIFSTTILTIEENAIDVDVGDTFLIGNSSMGPLNGSNFRIYAKDVSVVNSVFNFGVGTNAFLVTADTTTFWNNNFYNKVQKHAFDVTASMARFERNVFQTLEEEALLKVRGHTGIESIFTFQHNLIYVAQRESINPNKRISEKDSVMENNFLYCNTPSLSWFWGAAHGSNVSQLTKDFYAHFLREENHNVCLYLDERHVPKTCSIDKVADLYNPDAANNQIRRFANATNAQICNYLINASNAVQPTVIIIVQIFCFYLTALVMQY
ncbi:uncharacterized protein LOC132195211 [Neocloeon triangulifer]|uniref:uncharacterized protein LOC132195211 n=1 Tax=Neocloeon triangulifer TaxID=2078957 RepID=UPI00286F57D9|nr:uncharacterized protein LOC132195211 [Neocloeon triangulifer]